MKLNHVLLEMSYSLFSFHVSPSLCKFVYGISCQLLFEFLSGVPCYYEIHFFATKHKQVYRTL